MSAPPPVTVQLPLVSPADPARPGEPMSASVQPGGSAAHDGELAQQKKPNGQAKRFRDCSRRRSTRRAGEKRRGIPENWQCSGRKMMMTHIQGIKPDS